MTSIPQVFARVSLCWPPMTIWGQKVASLRMCKRSNWDFFQLYNLPEIPTILSSPVFFLRCLLGVLALWGQKPCRGNNSLLEMVDSRVQQIWRLRVMDSWLSNKFYCHHHHHHHHHYYYYYYYFYYYYYYCYFYYILLMKREWGHYREISDLDLEVLTEPSIH